MKSTLKEFKGKNTHATALFIEKLETRLDTALYRTYFSDSFNHARQLILHKKVTDFVIKGKRRNCWKHRKLPYSLGCVIFLLREHVIFFTVHHKFIENK